MFKGLLRKRLQLVLVITATMMVAACVDDHIATGPYVCDESNPISFAEIAPIVGARCASAGCHSSSNNYIPRLDSKQYFAANRDDSKAQILRGAMPPSGYSLTATEKDKILCWLNYGD